MLNFTYKKIPPPPTEEQAGVMRLSAEETAAMGRLIISANNEIMTRGTDDIDQKEYNGPFVANYYLGQWLLWNYWRLRWEGRPKKANAAWLEAHSMRSVGEGYVWPDITFSSDGERVALSSNIAHNANSGGFKYAGSLSYIVQARDFDCALDKYIKQTIADLDSAALKKTNLQLAWQDIQEEKADPALARKRCFEAILGSEPDAGDGKCLKMLEGLANAYNEASAREFAALLAGRRSSSFPEADIKGKWGNMVVLAADKRTQLPKIGQKQAWELGRKAAAFLRSQEKLGDGFISDKQLEEMAGLPRNSVISKAKNGAFSVLKKKDGSSDTEIFLRGQRETSRRFSLSRILADKILYEPQGDILEVAGDNSATYRQKAQRAFAAEFLCPIESLQDYLRGGYKPGNIKSAAQHFGVSELTIKATLANHGLIERADVGSAEVENEDLLNNAA